jgi:hypothetical protein
MKYSDSYLYIHGLISQGESARFISDRFGISKSIVYRVKNYKQTKISSKSTDKILYNYAKLRHSKKKADKIIFKEIERGFEAVKTAKNKKELLGIVQKIKRSKSNIMAIANELMKQDKRRKKGKGKKYKNSWYGKYMSEYYESMKSVEVK